MTRVHAQVQLVNAADIALAKEGRISGADVRRRNLSTFDDNGSMLMVVPASLRDELGLNVIGTRMAILGDGYPAECDLVGAIEVRLGGQALHTDALVKPGTRRVELGKTVLSVLCLTVDLETRTLVPDPANPHLRA